MWKHNLQCKITIPFAAIEEGLELAFFPLLYGGEGGKLTPSSLDHVHTRWTEGRRELRWYQRVGSALPTATLIFL
jgi:hypothetical protein